MTEEEEDKQASPSKSQTTTTGPKRTKILDADTINKAVEITSEQVSKKLAKSIPKTAAGFETDYNSLKKDLTAFYGYLRNIPNETILTLFKTVEISSELFAAILKVLNEQGIKGDDDSLKHAAGLMCALGKASGFDMTLMFMDAKEKKDLVNIVQTLKKNSDKLDKETIKQIDTIYKI